ncbi:MAG TPA: insulinase family protein [Anaerolineae bacterium]|nr:insulinase family protein [Anaerolineae bacterium]
MHGFELVREEMVVELNTQAQLWRHVKTGAPLLSLHNDDENKVFGISFKTPPEDDTGLPHILEHCVLGGSEKYPVKEPFVEMLKGSLQTFLNAFTMSDKTVYPVASTNEKDFYNLVGVYLDAVLNPLLLPDYFAQQAWYYELEEVEAPLKYRGVVFNEMKGAYSSPGQLMGDVAQRSLFDDGHVYAFDSGGNPAVMPDLSYEQFLAFHKKYYHPSNALLCFYGDMPLEGRLEMAASYLDAFEAQTAVEEVPLQPLRTEPQRVEKSYPVEEGSDEGQKRWVSVNWLLAEQTDITDQLALDILSHILLGTSAAPLRHALIASGLGEGLASAGVRQYQRQPMMSVGLKGVVEANVDKVETLVLETLGQLAADGLPQQAIEASLNTIEFSLRENNTGSFPRGLVLMMRALGQWGYDRDMFAALPYEAPLTTVRERLAADERYFEKLIEKHFLSNEHRTLVVLVPDSGMHGRLAAAEQARLEAAKAEMSQAELEALVVQTEEIRAIQNKPNAPEDLAKLPTLSRDDLDPKIQTIPIVEEKIGGVTTLHHDLFTNGILYIDVGFNLRVLPAELLPYLSLFSRGLLQMGTNKEDFISLSQRIGRTTGGIQPGSLLSDKMGQDECVAWLFLSGKGTMAQVADMMQLLQELWLTVDWNNQERFRQMVLESKAGLESSLVGAGHSMVNARLSAHFTEAGWVNEQVAGIEYLFFLRQLAQRVDNDWAGVQADLEKIQALVVNRNNMLIDVTIDEENWVACKAAVATLVAEIPAGEVDWATWERGKLAKNEGLAVPAQVNFVGKGANLYELGYEHHGSTAVIAHYLRTSYLWHRVRMQGGAYGAFCSFDSFSGIYTALSYRDPNLLETIQAYDEVADYLQAAEFDDDDITRAIIGIIGRLDTYRLPDAKGWVALNRYLLGLDDEYRQMRRDEVLSTTVDHFRAWGAVLAKVKEAGHVVVLGSAEALQAANEAKGGDWLKIKPIFGAGEG